MLLPLALSLALSLFSATATATPIPAALLGSKHNLYLMTCKDRQSCPIPILCPRPQPGFTAVAYYENGPIESNRNINPTQLSTVDEPAEPWEGAERGTSLGRAGEFSSNIDSGAGSLESGQIAGVAKLNDEDFVCFSDGKTHFVVQTGLTQSYECTANYWCPSVQV